MSSSTESGPSSPGCALLPLFPEDGHPSPAHSAADSSAPPLTDLGQLSDAQSSSDWTESDKATTDGEHDDEGDDEDEAGEVDWDLLASSGELDPPSSAGRSSASSQAGDQRMRLSFPDPLTPSKELEAEHGVDGYSLMLDAPHPARRLVSPAPSSAHPRSSGSSIGTDSASEDKPPASTSDAKKAQTSAWVKRVKPKVGGQAVDFVPTVARPVVAETAEKDTAASASIIDLGASESTEVGQASLVSLKSVDSDLTVTAKDEPVPALAAVAVKAKSPLSKSVAVDSKAKDKVEVKVAPTPNRLSSQLFTRSLIVVATVLAISAARFLESAPSFANFPSTELATTTAAQPQATIASASTATSLSALTSVEPVASPAASVPIAVSSALAVVNADTSLSVIPPKSTSREDTAIEELIDPAADFGGDDEDWVDVEDCEKDEPADEELDPADEDEPELEPEDDELEEPEEPEADEEDDFDADSSLLLDVLAGWAGVPELSDKLDDLYYALDDKLSPLWWSARDFVQDTLHDLPDRINEARSAHRELRKRGQRTLARHAKQWFTHLEQHALKPSREFVESAWKAAKDDQPPLLQRHVDERWSPLGAGSLWKGLARRGLQGERILRSPAKMTSLIKETYKSSRNARRAAQAARKARGDKMNADLLAAFEQQREAMEHLAAEGRQAAAGGSPPWLRQQQQWRAPNTGRGMNKLGWGKNEAVKWRDRKQHQHPQRPAAANANQFHPRRHSLSGAPALHHQRE